MNRTAAIDIKTEALKAIEALSVSLAVALAGCDGMSTVAFTSRSD
jgi:hypothetical protein